MPGPHQEAGLGMTATAHPPGLVSPRSEKTNEGETNMKLLTDDIRNALLRNGQVQDAVRGTPAAADFYPVVKLFTPDAGCTWLLSELDPEDPDIAFGLCDLGMGFPELGSVRISELESVRGKLGLPTERDLHFSPRHTLSVYAEAARNASCITEREDALLQALAALRARGGDA
jgi:hypothetical protein